MRLRLLPCALMQAVAPAAAAAAAAAAASPLPSAGCSRPGPPLSPPGQLDSHVILVSEPLVPLGAHFRHFRIQLPSGYENGAPARPLVLDLHGFGSTSMIQYQNSGFANLTDSRDFIGVWPDGSGDCLAEDPGCEHSWEDCSCCSQGWNTLGTSDGVGPDGQTTCNPDRKAWGYYDCYASCGAACQPSPEDNTTETCISSSCWDDTGFVGQLLDHLEERLCFDLDRVHLSGAWPPAIAAHQHAVPQCATPARLLCACSRPLPRCLSAHTPRPFHIAAAAAAAAADTGLSNGGMFAYDLAHSRQVGPRVASIVPVAGLPLLGFAERAVPAADAPVAVMDVHGLLDAIVPANISNGFLGRPGPAGSTYSADGFYYVPLDNVTAAWAEVNRCEGPEAWRVHSTPYDGDLWWHCIEPYGSCERGAVMRCSSLAEHVWPAFSDAECVSDECEEDGGNCPFVAFAGMAMDFMETWPRWRAANVAGGGGGGGPAAATGSTSRGSRWADTPHATRGRGQHHG